MGQFPKKTNFLFLAFLLMKAKLRFELGKMLTNFEINSNVYVFLAPVSRKFVKWTNFLFQPQYQFCYQCLMDYVASFDLYVNFKWASFRLHCCRTEITFLWWNGILCICFLLSIYNPLAWSVIRRCYFGISLVWYTPSFEVWPKFWNVSTRFVSFLRPSRWFKIFSTHSWV